MAFVEIQRLNHGVGDVDRGARQAVKDRDRETADTMQCDGLIEGWVDLNEK